MDEVMRAVFRRYESMCGVCFRNVFDQHKFLQRLWRYVFRSNRLERETREAEMVAPSAETWFTPKGKFHEAVFLSNILEQAHNEFPLIMRYDEDRKLHMPRYKKGWVIALVKPKEEGGEYVFKNCRLLCIFCWAKIEEERKCKRMMESSNG